MKTSIYTLITTIALTLTACSGGDPTVNKYLDSYEDLVEKMEKQAKSGPVSPIKLMPEINKINQLKKEFENIDKDKISDAQMQRYISLTERMVKTYRK